MIVKDRIAIGDNKYIMKQLNDGSGRIELIPSPDEVIEEGTTLNKAVLQPIFDGLDKIATVDTVVNQGKQEIQTATNQAVERISNAQPETNPKIYTVAELTEPQEGKIYNVKITENTLIINGKSVYKENTTQSVTLKAGKVATVYYQGGNFFYKASASGNATSSDVLAGKKFSNDDDTDITGTMKDNGRKIIRPSTSNIIIPKGFHDGTGYVEGDSDLVASNIVQGKNIFGVSGQALQYQQSEKDAIANALTSKGVPTSTTATWGQIEQNIRNVKQLTVADVFNKISKETKPVHIPYSELIHGQYARHSAVYYSLKESFRYSFYIEAKKNDIIFLYGDNFDGSWNIKDVVYLEINEKSKSDSSKQTGCYLKNLNELSNEYSVPVLGPKIYRNYGSHDTPLLFIPNTDGRYKIDMYTKTNTTPYVDDCTYFILKASEYLV